MKLPKIGDTIKADGKAFTIFDLYDFSAPEEDGLGSWHGHATFCVSSDAFPDAGFSLELCSHSFDSPDDCWEIDGIIGASDDAEFYEFSISDKFLVVCGSQIEVFPDEGSADSRCLEYALHGNACTKVWPSCSPDYPEGWPDEDFAPLDSSKIISCIGQKNYDDLVADAHNFGYSWFYNLQEGDPDTIYGTVGWGFPCN